MNHRAFTLIETLVAIAVLMIAIVGPYSIANTAIVASRTTQNELIASYLAQEPIEFVRTVRDMNFSVRISGENPYQQPFSYLDACVNQTCVIDSKSYYINTCPMYGGAYVCPPLYKDENGLYNQQESGEETIFTRSVQITDNVSYMYTHEATVTTTVSWSEHGVPRSYTLEETLYDWLGYAN